MRLILQSRSESAGNPRVHLQFHEEENPDNAGVQLSGWFEATYAMGLTVGGAYDIEPTLFIPDP